MGAIVQTRKLSLRDVEQLACVVRDIVRRAVSRGTFQDKKEDGGGGQGSVDSLAGQKVEYGM